MLDGRNFSGKKVLLLPDGRATVTETEASDRLPLVAPGMVDIHVNGYAGVDFNDEITLDGYIHAMRALYQDGVVLVLPTLITNDPDRITHQLGVLESLRKKMNEKGLTDVACGAYYHLEGPFISREAGYRGAHPQEYIQDLTLQNVQKWVPRWCEAGGGRIRIITVSPEGILSRPGCADALVFIRNCGSRVALGHTNATMDEIHAAAAAGASLAVHLGTACPSLMPRHTNPLWAMLADNRLWISMIADGFHLPYDMLHIFQLVKGEHTIMVSDATKFTAQAPGDYKTHLGGEVTLTPEGKLHVKGDPTVLAGAACGLFVGWCNAVRYGLDASHAWTLVSRNPALFIGYPPVELPWVVVPTPKNTGLNVF